MTATLCLRAECSRCIDGKRLLAIPDARLCIDCQRTNDVRRKRADDYPTTMALPSAVDADTLAQLIGRT